MSPHVVSGDSHMSPGILAQLWTEEEAKRKDLEDRMREYLCTSKVSTENKFTTLVLAAVEAEGLCRLEAYTKIPIQQTLYVKQEAP